MTASNGGRKNGKGNYKALIENVRRCHFVNSDWHCHIILLPQGQKMCQNRIKEASSDISCDVVSTNWVSIERASERTSSLFQRPLPIKSIFGGFLMSFHYYFHHQCDVPRRRECMDLPIGACWITRLLPCISFRSTPTLKFIPVSIGHKMNVVSHWFVVVSLFLLFLVSFVFISSARFAPVTKSTSLMVW